MRKSQYIFPALLHYGESGVVGVTFPDLPGCVSQADDDVEALCMAVEGLELHLFGMEEAGMPIPEPSSLRDLAPEVDERTTLVVADMLKVREEMRGAPTLRQSS